MLQGKTVSAVNDNDETYVKWDDKVNILKKIKDANKKLVILEIVPFEEAGIMDKLVGTKRVTDRLDDCKSRLYPTYESTKVVSGDISTVTVKGIIASKHPFTISYNSTTKTYSYEYQNSFLNSIVDSVADPELYNYFKTNIEVRTVAAAKLTEADLNDVSLIYIASKVESKEIVAFNMFLNEEIGSAYTNSSADNKGLGIYSGKSSRNEYKLKDATNIWYDDYYKVGSDYVRLDINWDMARKVIDYVYKGNSFTDNKPIPCIVNFANPDDYTANIYKLSVLLMETTNNSGSEVDDVSTYYTDVLNKLSSTYVENRRTKDFTNNLGLKTVGYKKGTGTNKNSYVTNWSDTSVPIFKLDCNNSSEYLFNYVFKTNNSEADAIFGIGNVNNCVITDAGSAYYRGVVGEDTDKYTPGDALAYLLGYKKPTPTPGPTPPGPTPPGPTPPAGDPEYVADDTIRVLEIEPCRDFLYYYDKSAANAKKTEVFNRIRELGQALNISEYSSTNLKTYTDYENLADKRIEFKCVATSEFNGLNEDLVATYDIIIIGTQTGTMPTKDGKTIFNDTELDGYIYLAYGDLIKYSDKLAGYLPSEFMGIDSYLPSKINKNGYTIDTSMDQSTTNWKGQKVVFHRLRGEYVWAPLIQLNHSDNFLVLKSIQNTFSGVKNVADYYDNSLGNARLTGNDITEKKLNELLEYVNIGRPIIMADNLYKCVSANNKTAYPTSKVYRLVNEKASKDNVISINNISTSLSGIMHTTTLEITNHTMTYEKDGTKYNAPEIKYITTGTNKDLIDSSCIIQNVNIFEYSVTFNAKAGTSYYVKLLVDKNTDGRFKSEPTVDDFNEVYYSKIIEAPGDIVYTDFEIELAENYNGMFTWQLLIEELDSRKNVVDAVSKQGSTVIKGETKVVKVLQIVPNTSCNLNMGTNNSFKSLLAQGSNLINYSITIDVITADDFEKKFKTNKYTRDVSYGTSSDYLIHNGYNMLVIGFADSFGKEDISDEYGALSCVVDFIENGNSVLFSHDTMIFVPSGNAGITGTTRGGKFSISTTSQWGERVGSIMTNALRDLVGMDRYSVTTIQNLTAEELEKANVPKKANGEYITEIQGFSDWILLWFTHCGTYKSSRASSGLYTLVPVKAMANYLAGGGAYNNGRTYHVDELNRGQVSMYPFDTTSDDGSLKVAYTHSQYYQLNLEDPDIVVWYTLTKKDSNDGSYCGDAMRDAANSYYIYSKRNITYSGAGHSSMSETSELKLFVNTVIRAAVAGNFIPEVDILNGSRTASGNTYVIFPNVMDTRILVQFEATDDDLADRENVENTYTNETEILEHIGRFQEGKVYWITSSGEEKVLKSYSPDGTYLLNGEPTSIYIENPSAIRTEEDRNMAECYQEYLDEGYVELKFVAKDYYGAEGSSTVKIIQHELFPLN